MSPRPARSLLMTRLTTSIAGLLVVSGAMAAPSTRLAVTGAVSTPTTYTLPGLQALPAITQAVSFGSASGTQSHTYTGASLWGILNAAGIVTNPTVKNDVLNQYVLVTGSDGYKSVFSLGELDPKFGNRPDLVAYAQSIGGVTSPLVSDGFARITAPGDVKGGRYVSNVVDLDVRHSGSTSTGTGGGTSTHFTVTGTVASSMTFSLAALKNLTPVTEAVAGHTYTGVSFWDLLSSTVGIDLNPAVKNDVLGKYVVATGSDGYQSVFSLGELDTAFGDQPDLIAYDVDGSALGSNGFARLVVPGDVKMGRWVSNLVDLEVFSAAAVPEAQTWALLLGGLGMVAVASRRRSRTARPAHTLPIARSAVPCFPACRRGSGLVYSLGSRQPWSADALP